MVAQVRWNACMEGWSWSLRAEWRNLLLWLRLTDNKSLDKAGRSGTATAGDQREIAARLEWRTGW